MPAGFFYAPVVFYDDLWYANLILAKAVTLSMQRKISGYKNYFVNLIFPAVVFGGFSGILTGAAVVFYKFCAAQVITWSEAGYALLRQRLWLLPVVLAALFGVAVVFARQYKKRPSLQGGGIPTSIGVLRGILPFRWLSNLAGTFLLSLGTFFIGVPLGNEGPSVQIGTAIGRGSVYTLAKKHRAWDRYAMTGGACAGFATATGAPVSGLLFAVEEAHQSISPMILLVAASSVLFARVTAVVLSPLFGVSDSLFGVMSLPTLEVTQLWIPLLVGAVVGLFGVVFLRFYRLINHIFNKTLGKVPMQYKIFGVFAATVLLGLLSSDFVSTGHHLLLNLFAEEMPAVLLLLIVVVRSTLTLSANSTGITGGLFLPMLALGAIPATLVGKGLLAWGVDQAYFQVVLVLGVTACIAGMMKIPLTAILFSLEALSMGNNILAVLTVATVSFVITEIFNAKSINDNVTEARIEKVHAGKTNRVLEAFVTVQPGAFAAGKTIRNILWPSNLFVLSVRHPDNGKALVDVHGGQVLAVGDVLHVRYSTFDEQATADELLNIVGIQEYKIAEVKKD